MSCPNCKAFQHLCKSACCGYVPIDLNVWEHNQHNIQTPPKEILSVGPETILPITPSGNCPFLAKDLSCAIYNDRPEVCQLFGNESHINLTCSYQKANGEPRSFHERKRLNKKQNSIIKKRLT